MKNIIKLLLNSIVVMFLIRCSGGHNNIPPVAVIDGSLKTYINVPTRLDGTKSMDPEGAELKYYWEITTAPAGAKPILADGDTPEALFIGDVKGVYQITLIVSDGKDSSIPEKKDLIVFDDNYAPIADAGEDRKIRITDTVSLDGSQSADPRNKPVSYKWSFKSKPVNSIAVIENSESAIARFKPDISHFIYEIQLLVSNGQYESEPDVVRVEVINTPPVPEAGMNQTVHPGGTVILHGEGSDIDGDNIQGYEWKIVSSPKNAGILSSPSTQDTILYTDSSPDAVGDYIIELRVYDGFDWSEPDTVVVSTINAPPNVDAGVDRDVQHCYVANTGYVVTNNANPQCPSSWNYLQLNGTAVDPEGDDFTLQWSVVSKPSSAPSPLIETPASKNTNVRILSTSPVILGEYVFRLTAVDRYGASSYDDIKITVRNRPPASGGCNGSSCRQSVSRSGCTQFGSLCYTQPNVTFNNIMLKATDPDNDPIYPETYRSPNDSGYNCIEGSNVQCSNGGDCSFSITLKAFAFIGCSNSSTYSGTSTVRLKFRDGFYDYYDDTVDDVFLTVICTSCN